MLAIVHASALLGIDALPVIVEAEFTNGLPGFDVIGLPEAAVRESRVRVKASLEAIGVSLPKRRLLLNLAPGDLRKTSSSFDLAIAVAVMAACSATAPNLLESTMFLGELSLSGELRAVRGALAHIRSARTRGMGTIIVPIGNAEEAAVASDVDVRVAKHINDVVAFLDGRGELSRARPRKHDGETQAPAEDLVDVRGQHGARRALEIAAAGSHHVLLMGPPGTGKTMLARRLPTILPPPSPDEAIDIVTIGGVAGTWREGRVTRPFRAPHHQTSPAALVGGGHPIRPGEVTLAHGGVLFLDELPEFRRDAIESLRITMEVGEVCVARAQERIRMPARAQVVAAMNPCPCGHAGHPRRVCTCSPDRVEQYRTRVSGPILDRFDLHVIVPPVPARALRKEAVGESSAAVRERVVKAREVRAHREADSRRGSDVAAWAPAPEALTLLDRAVERLGLSARGYAKTLRVARTIADLEGVVPVGVSHVAEALQYRMFDRAQQELPPRVGEGRSA